MKKPPGDHRPPGGMRGDEGPVLRGRPHGTTPEGAEKEARFSSETRGEVSQASLEGGIAQAAESV